MLMPEPQGPGTTETLWGFLKELGGLTVDLREEKKTKETINRSSEIGISVLIFPCWLEAWK